MDYHHTFQDYLAAKLRLFGEAGAGWRRGGDQHAMPTMPTVFWPPPKARTLKILTVGEKGETIRLAARAERGDAQALTIVHAGQTYHVVLPLAGAFQASNALVAAGLAIGLGEDAEKVFAALGGLKGAPGRMEKVAFAASGAPIYVDYAHTPDSLEKVLQALRPHTREQIACRVRLRRRPRQGQAPADGPDCGGAGRRCDRHRRQSPQRKCRRHPQGNSGRRQGAREIGDRHDAIRAAIAALKAGDVLVIAGKGHETGQYVGGKVLPFSDREEALQGGPGVGRAGGMSLWTSAEAEAATLGQASKPFAVNGLSIDTRTIQEGDLFVALKGDNRDGHDFVAAAFAAKAGAALVSHVPPGVDGALLDRRPYPARAGRSGGARRGPAATPKSWPSPAAPARPPPRKSCAWPATRWAAPMPRRRPTTIIGACRCRWRRCRATPNMACSKSA